MGTDTYAELADRVANAVTALAAVADGRGSTAVAAGGRALAGKLAEQGFNVVVVGEFKRGKSTFVNALLGAEVLPSAVVPLTSIVTAVTFGPRVEAEITFTDGRVEQVPPSALPAYITERENPQNGLGVGRALVRYPSDDLRDGVFLVDTPGVGSVFRHNTDAARAFVPEADAAIFLTSADPPISAAERAFLQDVRAAAARMFFVLNKVDYLEDRDRQESIAFTEEVLAGAIGRPVTAYPLSARRALRAKLAGDAAALEASGLPAFERAFRRFLLADKGATILLSVCASAGKLLADERNSLEVEEHAARLPVDRLQRASAELERAFDDARVARDDIKTLLAGEMQRLVGVVEADLAELRRRETPLLLEEAERFLAGADDLRGAVSRVDEHLKSRLRESIERWRPEEERRVAEAFTAGTARFVDEANRLVERTIGLCSRLLGVELSGVAAPEGITPETRFTFSFFEVPSILASVLPDVRGFLPTGLGRRLALKQVRERTPDLVDKHCGRLRWDFVQRLDRSRISLERLLDERLDATIESLRLGLRRAAEDRGQTDAAARTAAERVAEARTRLAQIDDMLGEVRRAVTAPESEVGARAG